MYHTDAELQGVLLGPTARCCMILLRLCIIFVYCGVEVTEFAAAQPVPESECAPSMQLCGNLGGAVMYPFGKKGSLCGVSPKFQLSNCNNTTTTPTTAYWDEFYGSPAVLGYDATGVLNLTWTNSSTSSSSSTPISMPACHVYPREQLPLFLPNSTLTGSGINFQTSADFSAFSLSPNNIFLLFSCTNTGHANASNYIETNSKNCKSFKTQCPNITDNSPCVQFQPQRQLDLQKAMTLSGCSQFQFFLTMDASLPVKEWKPHVVQLSWAPNYLGSSCQVCNNSNGTCGYADDGAVFQCFCPNNQSSATDCNPQRPGSLPRSTIRLLAVFAGLLAVILMTAIFSLWWLRRKRRIFTSRSAPNSNNKPWSQRAHLLSSRLGPICAQEYSYQEVLAATHDFADDNIIGDGGFGSVYLGSLKDDRLIAVKRLFHDNFSRMDHFYNEIQIISRLDHPNLVKFHGFCCEDDRDLLLVFEYLPNGSVFDQLHHDDVQAFEGASRPRGAGIPSWRVRLTIAMETAEALCYLHNFVSPPILHRDVKTTNILLDEGFHAKLADFGLSRLVPLDVTHVSTAPQGTPGYVDPEYHSCYRLTDKSDVYSFGVVLMELVSSKKAVDMLRSEKEINLSSMALLKEKQGKVKELVDTQCWQTEEDTNVEVVVGEVIQLAFQCLQPEKADRPCMRDVAASLTKLWQSHVC